MRFAKPRFSSLFVKSDIKKLLAGEKVNGSIFAYEENLRHIRFDDDEWFEDYVTDEDMCDFEW